MPRSAKTPRLAILLALLSLGCGGSDSGSAARHKEPLNTGGLAFRDLPADRQAAVAKYPTLAADVTPPASFDGRTYAPWTDTNGDSCLTPPWTQTDTDFCWAFSSCTAVSDRYRILNRTTPTGSMFNAVSYPGFNPNDGGWDGPPITVLNGFAPLAVGENALKNATDGCKQEGNPMEAYDYLTTTGGPLFDQFKDSTNTQASVCSQPFPSLGGLTTHKVGQPYFVTPTKGGGFSDPTYPGLIQSEVYLNGPVCVHIRIAPGLKAWFQGATSATDVFDTSDTGGNLYNDSGNSAKLGGHLVVIVGWGTTSSGEDYWIIRNSWGPNYADGGYFKMLRGQNFCAIESNATACAPPSTVIE